VNTATPRLFIAATEQNTGKTTTAVGLYAALRKRRFSQIGFMKPVGQRFVEVEGKRIDEDSVLIRDTYQTQVPIEDMNPISVEPSFTRRYINHANNEALVKRIRHSFDRAAWEKDFVIVEGTGHAGVGSVFDLSNARVANILESKVLLITPGGVGRPIDEGALNKALFDKEGIEVIGVVMNKVLPEKMDSIRDIAGRGFERLGIELLGVIPRERMLSHPTLDQICDPIRGRYLRDGQGMNHVAHVMIGAMSSANLFRDVAQNTLLVVPGDREDVILAAISRALETEGGGPFCGIVLTDDMYPSDRLLEMIGESPLPVISSNSDSYSIASRIHSMTVKTLPGDREKIDRIQNLVSENVNISRILEKIGVPPVPAETPVDN